jgi:hypothetical protein
MQSNWLKISYEDPILPKLPEQELAICGICKNSITQKEVAKYINADITGYISNVPICQKCLQFVGQCHVCQKYFISASMVKYEGNAYCKSCFDDTLAICDGCGHTFYIDEDEVKLCEKDQQIYCISCYSEYCVDVQTIYNAFYELHPEHDSVLEKAAVQIPQEPQVYIDIFNDLPWNDQYGGNKWAEIAKTWKELLKIQSAGSASPQYMNNAIMMADHAFDLTHNSNSLFTKAKKEVQEWLLNALNTKRDLPPELYMSKLSPDVRTLFMSHYKSESTVPWLRHLYETQQQTQNRGMQEFMKLIHDEIYRPYKLKDLRDLLNRYRLYPEQFKNPDEQLMARAVLNKKIVDVALPLVKFIANPDQDNAVTLLHNLSVHINPKKLKTFVGKDFEYLIEKIKDIIPIISKDELEWAFGSVSGNFGGLWKKFLGKIPSKKKQQKVRAISNKWFKTADMEETMFYDFYALITIDCKIMGDQQRYCNFVKTNTVHRIVKELIEILERAVIREARHVSDQLSNNLNQE